MNREQFTKALKDLHAPLERQKARTNAVGEKYGAHSKEYRIECKKEAELILAIEPKEHEIWCSFVAFVLQEAIENGNTTKERALETIFGVAKDEKEDKKPAWREAYKQIKSLP